MSNANTPETRPVSDAQQDTQNTTESTPAAIPAFRFPFSADAYAPKKNAEQPRHPGGNQSNHDKRPHTPPRGTRRSMGKR